VKREAIHWEIKENVGYLTLASPPKNEMDTGFFEAFHAIMTTVEDSRELEGLIIRSEGRHFSSGANVDQLFKAHQASPRTIPPAFAKNSKAFRTLNNLAVPVIACISGICYGSGLELALCANFRIASPESMLCLPETGFGVMPGLGGIYNSFKCMGTARALEFVLTGASWNAAEALEYGLVDLIRGKNELTEAAKELVSLAAPRYRKELKPLYMKRFAEATQ